MKTLVTVEFPPPAPEPPPTFVVRLSLREAQAVRAFFGRVHGAFGAAVMASIDEALTEEGFETPGFDEFFKDAPPVNFKPRRASDD
jgi:hypothetical protein